MGNERLFPAGEVDPIPQWIFDLVVRPIVQAGIISGDNFINSAVIEEYQPRGCNVSHVDPPAIFSRYAKNYFIFKYIVTIGMNRIL